MFHLSDPSPVVGLGVVLFAVGIIVSVPNHRISDEAFVLTLPYRKIGVVLVFSSLSVVFLSLVLNQVLISIDVIVGVGSVVVYTRVLEYRGRKFRRDRKFFTPDNSHEERTWYDASVAFEIGLKQYNRRNGFRAYHWLNTANSIYSQILETTDRERNQRIATELKMATSVLLDAQVEGRGTKVRESFEEHIAAAVEAAQYVWCDDCTEVHSIETCFHVIDSEGFGKAFLCRECYYERESNDSKPGEKTSSSSEQSEEQVSESQSQSTRTTSGHSHNTRTAPKTNNSMSPTAAKDVLGVTEPLSQENIKQAFRDKVKDAHPDMGGSEEEFKRVKTARERLEESVE